MLGRATQPATAAAGNVAALAGGPLPQQRHEPVLRHRLPEEETLADVAAHTGQRQRVGCLLDPDADGMAAEIMGQVDDGLA